LDNKQVLRLLYYPPTSFLPLSDGYGSDNHCLKSHHKQESETEGAVSKEAAKLTHKVDM